MLCHLKSIVAAFASVATDNLTWLDVQATAKEYGTAYGREEEVEEAEDDIRLETAADREARRLADSYSNSDNIPAPQVGLPLPLTPPLRCFLLLVIVHSPVSQCLCIARRNLWHQDRLVSCCDFGCTKSLWWHTCS